MPKKTTIFIIILAIVAIGLVFLAIRQANPTPSEQPGTQPPEEQMEPTALMYFENPTLTAAPGEQVTADVMLDSGGQQISGAQIYLQYDPTQLTITSITAPDNNFFGSNPSEYAVPFTPEIDSTTGLAFFAISQPPGAESSTPLSGIDRIATVTFTPNATFQGTATITIVNDNTIEETSMALPPGSATSILKSTTPLTVTVQ